MDLDGNFFPFTALNLIHHILQLKEKNADLDNTDLSYVNHELENVLNERPLCVNEYRLLEKILAFSDAMLIKWKIVNQDMYLYRTSGRTLLVKMLNLITMNKSFITIEIVWYAI